MPQKVATALILILLTRPWSALPQFDSVGESSGLRFTLTSGTRAKAYIPESMSGGVGFIDYDNDGWVDVFLVNGSTLEAERQRSNRPRTVCSAIMGTAPSRTLQTRPAWATMPGGWGCA